MAINPAIPEIREKLSILSVTLGCTQIELMSLLGQSQSSLSRLKRGLLRTITLDGVFRILTIDPDILRYLGSIGPYSNPQRAYTPTIDTKLSIQRALGELEGDVR